MGSSATSRCDTLAPMRAELTSTTASSPPETLTSVETAEGESVTLSVRSWPTCKAMPLNSALAMPGASAVSAYCDGSKGVAMYWPFSFAETFRLWPVFSFLTVTTAPGITAPEASEIVPTMRAASVWL